MEIELKIDAAFSEPKVVVYTAKVDDEINELLNRIHSPAFDTLVGFQDDIATILEPPTIVRLYAEKKKVYADTDNAMFALRMRLYEAENLLTGKSFVRISNSEIINLHKIDTMDLSFAGTICIKLQNGHASYVSRRYVSKIKNKLGL